MINLLWLIFILAVETALLWGAYKLFGKAGLFAFGAFAIIQAGIFANFSEVLTVGTVSVVASMIPWVLLLVALLITLEKYGRRAGLGFGIITAGIYFVYSMSRIILNVACFGTPVTFLSIVNDFGATFVAIIVEVIIGLVLFDAFKNIKLKVWLRSVIILAILIVIDVILFIGLYALGTEFSVIVSMVLTNLWQKAIIVALMVPVIFAFTKTKQAVWFTPEVPEPEYTPVAKKVVEITEEKPVAKKAETAKAKPVKATTKKTTTKKPVAKKAETKPAVKKATAKKPATKKTTKK